jgi:hypothetical protein
MAVQFQGLFSPLALRSVTGVTLANPALFYEIGDPLERPARIIKIDNLTDKDVFISMNSVQAWTVVPAGGFILLDLSTNKTSVENFMVPEGAQFWANAASAPTSGSVYVTAIGSRDM